MCFQLRAFFALLHIVEYINTDKFHLGCILFIQHIFTAVTFVISCLTKASCTFFCSKGTLARVAGHLFRRYILRALECILLQSKAIKSPFESCLQLKGLSKHNPL